MEEIKKVPFINPANLRNFSLRAAAVIRIDQKFVLVKNEGKDKYKLPGGHLRADESFSDGLKRELKEEIGIEINIPNSPAYFDQLVVDDLIVITGYFNLGNIDLSFEELIHAEKLPLALLTIDELSEQNTYVSEISAIRKIL